ncbi:unnamed protein product [Toxocara canis]|uniref:AMP-binding domain-containing protein n=1 Tax=Toxocara canis TaxID=6265 RepID=A0A183VGK9_TOXCA|nr:unnamed protein product [Toxocara canis]
MVEYSDKLFHLQILDAAEKYGDSIAMRDGQTGESTSYAKLREDSYRFGRALKSIGAKKGDIICVVLPNCAEYVITFLGAALVGCTLSGVSPDSTQGYFKYQQLSPLLPHK